MSCGDVLLLCVSVLSVAACSGLCPGPSSMCYRAVTGDMFSMPCERSCRIQSHSHSVHPETEDCPAQFRAEEEHSGVYKCLKSGDWRTLLLQVVNQSLGCWSPEENRQTLWIRQGGNITCPGHNCSDSATTAWYKGNRSVSEMRRKKSFSGGWLYLNTVSQHDNAVFYCDREQSLNWTMRRSVTVQALDPDKYPPRILYPENNTVQELELGSDHTLRCEAYFPKAHVGDVQWFMISRGHLLNLTMEISEKKELEWQLLVVGKATLRKVTAQDINRTYTCIARNALGNVSASITFKKKKTVQWSSLVEYALGPLLLVTGLTIVLRVKWLEIRLILKSRCSCTFSKADIGHKDFDVLLSYVWSTSSSEPVSSPYKHSVDDRAFPFCLDSLAVDIPSERPELLLPHVLEDQWGYRLCLLDRDCLPGGAYTKEVTEAIQKSQMLIFLLSAEYLSDNNAVFVLESGVQALLQNSGMKVLLIWTKAEPLPRLNLDPPLPVVVQRALKVLPALRWTSAANTDFWSRLRKALPHQRLSAPPKSL